MRDRLEDRAYAELAAACLRPQPRDRPPMAEAARLLQQACVEAAGALASAEQGGYGGMGGE